MFSHSGSKREDKRIAEIRSLVAGLRNQILEEQRAAFGSLIGGMESLQNVIGSIEQAYAELDARISAIERALCGNGIAVQRTDGVLVDNDELQRAVLDRSPCTTVDQ